MLLYVTDVDKQFKQALAAGGHRGRGRSRTSSTATARARSKDPFGHTWHLSTHKEDVSMEEMARRMAAMRRSNESGVRSYIPTFFTAVGVP